MFLLSIFDLFPLFSKNRLLNNDWLLINLNIWLFLYFSSDFTFNFGDNFWQHHFNFFFNDRLINILSFFNFLLFLNMPDLWDVLLDDVLIMLINMYFVSMFNKIFTNFSNNNFGTFLSSGKKNFIVVLILEGDLVSLFIKITQPEFIRKALKDWRQGAEQLMKLWPTCRLNDVNLTAKYHLENHRQKYNNIDLEPFNSISF